MQEHGNPIVDAFGIGGVSASQDEACAMAAAERLKQDYRETPMSMRLSFHSGMAIVVTVLMGLATNIQAQSKPLGEFEDHADIGAPKKTGDATYDVASQQYFLTAGGANMFGAHDEFQFVWRTLRGDFILQARIQFVGQGVEAHRKAGLMARSSLSDSASYVDGVIHGNGPTAVQVRRTDGANTEMLVTVAAAGVPKVGVATQDADFVQLERRGNTYIFSAAKYGQPVTQRELAEFDLGDELYVGLFLCAHNPGVTERAIYRDVRILRPGKTNP